MKLWNENITKKSNSSVNDFDSSILFDSRMYKEDIDGSIAHVIMLGQCGIIQKNESDSICDALEKIKNDIEKGTLKISTEYEDIHTFIEAELVKRLGMVGKKIHTARSRNDQVALDLKIYLKNETDEIITDLKNLILVICEQSTKNIDAIMPGYTHLQKAQPVTFSHHLMAYAEMFLRDIGRLKDAKERMDEMPLGSAALATTTHPINRSVTTLLLGFDRMTNNSLDSVSDRDFCVELTSALSLIMVHLSRFCEDIILWFSSEFKFIEIDPTFCSSSSIMPQKKNPYIAELVRGKTGRVFGDLTALLTMLKALPLSYNKDMQEDKEAIFDAFDTVKMCLNSFIPMLKTIKANKENMRSAAESDFINATDCEDYLVKKGMPFKDAYKAVNQLVTYCTERKITLSDLSLDEYRLISNLFEEDIYETISLESCIESRNVTGGPSKYNVLEQIKRVQSFI